LPQTFETIELSGKRRKEIVRWSAAATQARTANNRETGAICRLLQAMGQLNYDKTISGSDWTSGDWIDFKPWRQRARSCQQRKASPGGDIHAETRSGNQRGGKRPSGIYEGEDWSVYGETACNGRSSFDHAESESELRHRHEHRQRIAERRRGD
jgi:hypothetical protein